MKETKEFKTQTKKLLDMMINSIYTHKEIFLRELVSNASDAIDKRHYLSLTDTKLATDYEIKVEADKAAKTIIITDNGVGMTKEDLENNLGTIAKSGSEEFIEKLGDAAKGDVDIIGQFGVGFYSAFMVAKHVSVLTKNVNSDKAYLFESDGLDSYSIEEAQKDEAGTIITLYLRDDTEEEKYSEYLDEYKIQELIKKYSDYVRYPIKTWVTKYDPKDENDKDDNKEPKTHLELETINSMLPIWKKNKSDVTEKDLNEFYKNKFMDYQDPITSIQVKVEGNITYEALLFIPKKPMYDFMNDNNERGLKLYTKGVFILDKCKELVPEYLRFVKGLVDSADLPLNISRETLQEDRAIKKIAKNVETKILGELSSMLKNDRKKYEEFYSNYGINLKYGTYENWGEKKEKLQDLILLKSYKEDKLITFKEYVDNMKEGQKAIYFVSAKDKEQASRLPEINQVLNKDYDLFILSDGVDEFMLDAIKNYNEKPFKNISKDDLELLSDDENKKIDELKEEKKDFLNTVKEAIPSVKDVVISKKLTDRACSVSAEGQISFEMERVLKAQNHEVKADRIFELNPNHPMFEKLEGLSKDNKDLFNKYVNILYNESLLEQGIIPDDTKTFAENITELLMK